MSRELAATLMIIALVVFLFLVWSGWRRRVGRYADLPALLLADDLAGSPIATYSLLYVATTEADKPMERVAKKPLGFRARMVLGVGPEGLWLTIPGEDSVVLPATSLRGVGRATWTIDRVVEADGLVFVRWAWGERLVDSYFRSVDYPTDDLVTAIEDVVPPRKGSA